jgi:RHS repeat-associated protein
MGNTFTLDLYDTPNREYSDMGRWPSPDPAGLAATDLTDPQSWNRYAYVLNDPLDLVDPLGLYGNVPDGCVVTYPNPGGAGVLNCASGGATGGDGVKNRIVQPFLESGGGSTIGPGKPIPPPCRIIDPVLGALELVLKAGPESQFGPVKIGASLYKNVTSGEKGIKAEVTTTLFGGQVDSKLIPQNGSYQGSAQEPEISVSFLGFAKNLTKGAPIEFGAQKTLGLGLQLGIGFEVVVNRAKFDALSKANDACRAQGGT